MRMLLLLLILAMAGTSRAQEGSVITCSDIEGVALERGKDGAIKPSPDGFSGFTLRLILKDRTLTALWDESAYENRVVRFQPSILAMGSTGPHEWTYDINLREGVGVFTRHKISNEGLGFLLGDVRVFWARCQ